MQLKFAGSMSVPVISQALGILASQGLATFDDEHLPDLDPDVTVLALAGPGAHFPNRFLRELPTDLEKRKKQAKARFLGVNDQVLEIPKLVLVHAPRGKDPNALYTGDELTCFEAALKNLAGIKPEKKAKLKKRSSGRNRSMHGLVRDIA